jgi:thiamine-phosphate diphosphorylase
LPDPAAPDRRRPPFSRLYPILDSSRQRFEALAPSVRALARAGVRLVQLRGKELSAAELQRWALAAREATRKEGMRLLVNDRADVALLAGADGVHLGQEDLSPESARRLLGSSAIIGLSTHDLGEARKADAAEAVDYVAIGPIFETSTTRSGRGTLGVRGARAVREAVKKPLVAIGGITIENAPALFAAGIDGVAVISALGAGDDLETTARAFMRLPGREEETK